MWRNKLQNSTKTQNMQHRKQNTQKNKTNIDKLKET